MISYLAREGKMTKHNMRFLSSVLVLCVFGIASVDAAPSVRMLGTNSARIGQNATVVKSNNNTNTSTQRLGTIRSKAVNTGTPATINKISTPTVASGSDSDARLSLGKYIHSTGVAAGTIKPATAANAGVTAADLAGLSDQVSDLENSKQNKLIVEEGSGLVLDSDVLSVDESILDLADQVAALQSQIEEKVSADDLSSAVSSAIEAQGGLNTIYDAVTGERKTVTIVDEFTDEDLEFIQKQGED